MPCKRLLSSVFLAICFFPQAALSFASGDLQESLSIQVANGIPNYYHPEVFYETYGKGVALPSGLGLAKGSREETAVSFAMHKLRVSSHQVVHRAGFASDITDHAYLSQVHNGIPFVNAVANVAVKDGRVVSFGSSFVKAETIAPSQPSVAKENAIAIAEAALDCTYDSHPTSLQYLANPDGSASLVHVIQVKNDETGKYYQAHVDAHSGKLVSTVNFVAEVQSRYAAVPINKNSILDGQSLLDAPEDLNASPLGWHRDTLELYKTTRGNNGYAYRAVDERYAGESSRATYAYKYDTRLEPTVGTNFNASIVNAFYVMNMVHDIAYRYGFTENAFNFQMSNFDRGGLENDGVIVSVNDRSNTNNAAFATLPDGQPGYCTLYLYNISTPPSRPSAMDNSIMVHEYGHGISNRLIGGGTVTCLGTPESRGLGEGWSDAFANWMAQTSANTTKDFTIGNYTSPSKYGLRTFPYSTDITVNSRKYSDVGTLLKVHDIGEVWANMLHNVYAKLVASHGHSKDALTNPNGTTGNVVFMHLFIDSLSLLPCNPDFLAARNGFIQADENRYSGVHRCLLWRVFASRGLGANALPHVDGYNLPVGC